MNDEANPAISQNSLDAATKNTPPQFPIEQTVEAVRAISNEDDPSTRLVRVGETFDYVIAPRWNSYAKSIHEFMDRLSDRTKSEISEIEAQSNRDQKEIERRLDLDAAVGGKQISDDDDDEVLLDAMPHAPRFIRRNVSRLQQLQYSSGLHSNYHLSKPEALNDASMQAARQYPGAVNLAVVHDASAYTEACNATERAKVITVEKAMTPAGVVGAVLFVVSWIAVGFTAGLIMGGLSLAVGFFYAQSTISRAKSAYEGLFTSAASEFAARAARASAENSKCRELAAIQIETVGKRFEVMSSDIRNYFEATLQGISEVLHELDTVAHTSLAMHPRLFMDISDGNRPSVTDMPPTLNALTSFRIGEVVLARLSPLSVEAARLLDYDTSEPIAPSPLHTKVPYFWRFGEKRPLVFLKSQPASTDVDGFATALLSRLLLQCPDGKVRLTLFDPIGLGRNFASFLKLKDKSDLLISGKVWSSRDHIRQQLVDLIEHIENVTQKYLRNDFPDIESYNKSAGQIEEPYRILVIADFPESFDDGLFQSLIKIIQNGPRCGVFTIIHWNEGTPEVRGVDYSSIAPFCVSLKTTSTPDVFTVVLNPGDKRHEGDEGAPRSQILRLDNGPPVDFINTIVETFGEKAKASMKVEVPYARMLELAKVGETKWWRSNSTECIDVPIGPAGARKVQTLQLGAGLAHHVLIAGRPGSGKSNLLHIMICAMCRMYPPDEVQLYLVDFKQGIEFKGYAEAKIPHARVIAVESEREFGLSVLEGLSQELSARSNLFKKLGCEKISEYRIKVGKAEKLPRIVLIVDEFQGFFSREDHIKRESEVLIDQLIKQGRSYGIHVILGTQTLANAGLSRGTMDQVTVRIALQCSEADSKLILADDNSAARLLTRPGEAIYNHSSGLVEANSRFQVAMFSKEDREAELVEIQRVAKEQDWQGAPPVIFEGHEPADIGRCRELWDGGQKDGQKKGKHKFLWLGEPISLKPTTTVKWSRRAGRNLLVLTREEEQGVGVVLASMLSIAVQDSPQECRFEVVDLTMSDAEWADHPEVLAASLPHKTEVYGRRDVKGLLVDIEAEVARRVEKNLSNEPAILFVMLGLHRCRDLRVDDTARSSSSFSMNYEEEKEETIDLPRVFAKILRDGPEVGVHTIIWCDTAASLERSQLTSSLDDLGLRITGPLSDADSNRILDSHSAAQIDKPHRMLKYDDDEVGVFELFRPYRLPTVEQLRALGAHLKSVNLTSGKGK